MKTHIKLFLIFGFTFLIACKNSDKPTSETEEQPKLILREGQISVSETQFKNADMALGKITENEFNDVVKVSGKIDVPPKSKASVSVPVGGYIKTINLLAGDKVRKGQVLVTIQNPDFIDIQQNYLEAVKKLAYLKSEYERNKTLFSENLISKKKFLKAESEYQMAKARHSGLKQQLEVLNISPQQVISGNITSVISVLSPINGTISKINTIKGAYVSEASEILQIIDNKHLHLELTVYEKDIMRLKKGQLIKFKLPENSEETFDAEIHLIGAIINKNNTVEVHGHLKNADKHNFLIGMFVEASIITDIKKLKSLPKQAVVEIDGDFYTLKLIEKKGADYIFEKIKLEVDQQSEDFVAVKNQFVVSDMFLVKNVFDLISGE